MPVAVLCRALEVSRAGFYAWAARRRRPFRVTTDSTHDRPVAPSLLARRFVPGTPQRGWVTDITFIATGEGWLYLAVILDLSSRHVLGWALREHLTSPLPLEAFRMALARRRPRPGLLHHSDRGTQYVGTEYQGLLARHGIVISMSRRGNCWDNAVAESFLATLKVELVQGATWSTREQARRAIAEYIELFSNPQRRHSSFGYRSPITFERQVAQAP